MDFKENEKENEIRFKILPNETKDKEIYMRWNNIDIDFVYNLVFVLKKNAFNKMHVTANDDLVLSTWYLFMSMNRRMLPINEWWRMMKTCKSTR